ncbi:hypothetical protein SUGI_0719390 [Cryptomeria japonica]|nr:hypothetical protein SUGI_0719390 [Cryptomeria japonica]
MERFIVVINKQGTRVKFEILDYKGELKPEVFMDWIKDLEKYYVMKEIGEEEPYRVKIKASKMKSHAILWWDNLQDTKGVKERRKLSCGQTY